MMKFRRLSVFDLVVDMELSESAKRDVCISLEGTEIKDIGNVCLCPKAYLLVWLKPSTVDEIERALHCVGLDFGMVWDDLDDYESRRSEEHFHDYCHRNWKNHKKGFRKVAENRVINDIANDLFDFFVCSGKFAKTNRIEGLNMCIQELKNAQVRREKFYSALSENRIKD